MSLLFDGSHVTFNTVLVNATPPALNKTILQSVVRLGPENPGRVSTTVSYCFIFIIGLNEIIRVDISPDFAGE
jgi:hypothetical protein